MKKEYYNILEVSELASKEVIEKAYKTLAKKYHPDANQDANKLIAEDKMKSINEAYEVVSDDDKRKQYDALLKQEKDLAFQEKVDEYVGNMKDDIKIVESTTNDTTQYVQQPTYRVTYTTRYTGFRWTLKKALILLATIACIILIFWVLWIIPPIRKIFINIYNNNDIVKFFVDVIAGTIKLKGF